MKTLSLIVALLVAGFTTDAYASGYGYGAAVVQQNVVVRQRVRVRPVRQRFSLRHSASFVAQPVYAAPIVAAPVVQSYVAAQVAVPYVQQVVVPQAVCVPQVQSYVAPQVLQFKGSCALGAGCF